MSERPAPDRLAAWRLFLHAHGRLIERLEAELDAARRLPLSWYDVLVQLHEAPDRCRRIQELGRGLALSGSGLSRRVSRMEEAGLVERRACPDDRRGVVVALTSRGADALRAAAPVHLRGIQDHFARHLSDDEAVALRSAFAKILDGLAAQAPAAPDPPTQADAF